jgi:uncharacterized phage protein (TIGR02220 family)
MPLPKKVTLPKKGTTKDTLTKDKKILSGPPSNGVPYQEIIEYLNQKTSKSFSHKTKKTKSLIYARWNEGYKLEDFKRVINVKSSKWIIDPQMIDYLRPETLFGTKFESYLNEIVILANFGTRSGA